MASVPSAAAQFAEQNNPLAQQGNILKLKSMLQGQQIQGQQIQENDIALKEKRDALADEEKIKQAFMQANGDLDKTVDLASQQGVRPETLLKLKAASVDSKQKLATLTKDQLANVAATNGMIAEHSQAILGLPTDKRRAALQQSMQQLAQSGALPPEQVQGIGQQVGPLDDKGLEDWLKFHATAAISSKDQAEARLKQLDEERKAALAPYQLETAKSEASIKGAEAKAVQEGGVAPGVPLENQAATAWLKKNPGKDLSDFIAWKAKQSPAALTLNNMLGQGSALDQQAERFAQSGELPAGFSRSPGTTAAIIKRAAELHPDANISANEAMYKGSKKALGELQSQFSKVSAFEGTALKNLDLYVEKVKAIPDLGSRFANVPLRMISGKMIGDANYAAMEAARQTAASEVGKVLSSATGSGVLSDSQKKEAQDILNGNYPLDATLKVVETLKQDLGNRHTSYQDEITHLQGLMGGTPEQAPPKSGAKEVHYKIVNGQLVAQ